MILVTLQGSVSDRKEPGLGVGPSRRVDPLHGGAQPVALPGAGVPSEIVTGGWLGHWAGDSRCPWRKEWLPEDRQFRLATRRRIGQV